MGYVRTTALLLALFCVFVTDAGKAGTITSCGEGPAVIGGTEDWDLVKDKRGIRVYLRKTPASSIKVFKGVVELEIDQSELVGLLWDVDSYTDWLVLCDEAQYLKKISETEQILYTMFKPLWPVLKRDSIAHCSIYRDSATGSVHVEICGEPGFIPERKGRVRVKLLKGYGKVTPIGDGKVELVYEILAEPAGLIPDWLVNFTLVDTPYTTLRNIQKMMPLKQYKGFDMSFIPQAED